MAQSFISELADKLGGEGVANTNGEHVKTISAEYYKRTDSGTVSNQSLQTALDGKPDVVSFSKTLTADPSYFKITVSSAAAFIITTYATVGLRQGVYIFNGYGDFLSTRHRFAIILDGNLQFKLDDHCIYIITNSYGLRQFTINITMLRGKGTDIQIEEVESIPSTAIQLQNSHATVNLAENANNANVAERISRSFSSSASTAVEETNIINVTDSTDGFQLTYGSTTPDTGVTKLFTVDDHNAKLSLGNQIASTYKEAISIVNGSATVNGYNIAQISRGSAPGLAPGLPSGSDVSRYFREDGTYSNIYEAYMEWGGRNISSGFMPLDAAMVSDLGANRFMFPKANGITVEYTRDGGTTWTDYGLSNDAKVALFSIYGTGIKVGKSDSTNNAVKVGTDNGLNYKARITIEQSAFGLYTQLRKLIFFIGTCGSQNCQVVITYQTTEDVSSSSTTWRPLGSMNLGGWSGYNVFNTSFTFGGRSGQYKKLRFLFECTANNTNADNEQYLGLNITNIAGFGGVGWTTSSNMAKTGHLYSYDQNQNATFPANVTATTFIGTLQGNADTATQASYLTGFTARITSNIGWGTLTPDNGYTTVTAMRYTSAGSQDPGAIAFGYKDGSVSCQIDGVFYQREGGKRVLDVSDINSSFYAPTGTGTSGQLLKSSGSGAPTWATANAALVGITVTSTSVSDGTTTFNKYTHPTSSGNKHVPTGGSSGQFLGWNSDGTAKWVANPNTDTKVIATAKSDNAEYKLLATASASPTSGASTEAVYDTNITMNPSTNTITSNIAGTATGLNPSTISSSVLYKVPLLKGDKTVAWSGAPGASGSTSELSYDNSNGANLLSVNISGTSAASSKLIVGTMANTGTFKLACFDADGTGYWETDATKGRLLFDAATNALGVNITGNAATASTATNATLATTATKLSSSAGGESQPVFFPSTGTYAGKPKAIPMSTDPDVVAVGNFLAIQTQGAYYAHKAGVATSASMADEADTANLANRARALNIGAMGNSNYFLAVFDEDGHPFKETNGTLGRLIFDASQKLLNTNITGNAATASTATSATTATTATKLSSSAGGTSQPVFINSSGQPQEIPLNENNYLTMQCQGAYYAATAGSAATAAEATAAISANEAGAAYKLIMPQAQSNAITGQEETGAYLSHAYNNTGYPADYGNVLTIGGRYNGVGGSQLFMEWSATNQGIAKVYYRNRRDNAKTDGSCWSAWKAFAWDDHNHDSRYARIEWRNSIPDSPVAGMIYAI